MEADDDLIFAHDLKLHGALTNIQVTAMESGKSSADFVTLDIASIRQSVERCMTEVMPIDSKYKGIPETNHDMEFPELVLVRMNTDIKSCVPFYRVFTRRKMRSALKTVEQRTWVWHYRELLSKIRGAMQSERGILNLLEAYDRLQRKRPKGMKIKNEEETLALIEEAFKTALHGIAEEAFYCVTRQNRPSERVKATLRRAREMSEAAKELGHRLNIKCTDKKITELEKVLIQIEQLDKSGS